MQRDRMWLPRGFGVYATRRSLSVARRVACWPAALLSHKNGLAASGVLHTSQFSGRQIFELPLEDPRAPPEARRMTCATAANRGAGLSRVSPSMIYERHANGPARRNLRPHPLERRRAGQQGADLALNAAYDPSRTPSAEELAARPAMRLTSCTNGLGDCHGVDPFRDAERGRRQFLSQPIPASSIVGFHQHRSGSAPDAGGASGALVQ